MRKIVIILGVLTLLGCKSNKGVCDAFHSGNPNHGKKPYYLRKK